MQEQLVLITNPGEYLIDGVDVLERSSGKSTPRLLPLFSDDPDQTGRKVPKLPDQIVQEKFLLRTNGDWSLNGHRWLLGADKSKFFTDSVMLDPCIYPNLFATDRDTGLRWTDSDKFTFVDQARKTVQLDCEVGLAVSAEPSNWGSFLFRIIPKLAWLKAVGVTNVLMYRQFPQQVELAGLLGYPEGSIIPHYPNCNYEVSSAIIPSQCHTSGYLDTFSREVFSGIGRRFWGHSKFGKRIYISRRAGMASARKRRCTNEEEVCKALASVGFDIVIPDVLSVAEQVAAFANADFVIGPAGAGMFNSVFCRPGTKLIDIESERHWIYAHCSLFSSLGLNFGVFWGKAELEPSNEATVHLPFSVNVVALLERIAQMEKY